MTFDTTLRTADPFVNPFVYTPIRKKKKIVNYKGATFRKTLAKQFLILGVLQTSESGMTITELAAAVGLSRQLLTYHVKKLVAHGSMVMVLEPCVRNGGIRFRCWDMQQLARHFSGMARRAA